MKKQTITLLTALALLLFADSISGNNIAVTNTKVTGQNTNAGVDNPANHILVQFDLNWENSWRTSSEPNNWDAAWVFVKYRLSGGEWQHASLNNNGHSGTAAAIDAGLLKPGSAFNATTNPALGVFIYRSADGTGNFSITGAQLRWNYGANGVPDNAIVDVKVFTIEMVVVPEGSFYLGSGGNEYGAFYKYPNTTNAYQVTSEAAIDVYSENNLLFYPPSSHGGTRGGPIPSAFPKGYAGFYCMKYEVTQQQYVDFLNTLTQTQANNRKYTNTLFRYAITGNTAGSYATTNPYVACTYLSWMDGAAYADWAGLRPMTELEYEKTCRGTVAPVANAYAWGNTTIVAADNITNPGAADETTNTSGANAVVAATLYHRGPYRVGVFAKASTTRTQAGASYYGIMELSGNLWERTVTVGNAEGRTYTGVHGNGALSSNGYADVAAWPGLTGGEVTGADGSGFRGGNWFNGTVYARASDRDNAAYTYTGRGVANGFRAVRRIP